MEGGAAGFFVVDMKLPLCRLSIWNTNLVHKSYFSSRKNKAKCPSDAVEKPLSLLHCHNLCLLELHHVVKLE